MLVPVAAALVALTAALSGYVMVKFFGVAFLGQPRAAGCAEAHDAGPWERTGLAWLAAGCVALGLAPATVIGMLDPITRGFTGYSIAGARRRLAVPRADRAAARELQPAPVPASVAALLVAAAWLAVRAFYHGRVRRAPPWDCGFRRLDARMQDSAEGFGQPITVVFRPAFLHPARRRPRRSTRGRATPSPPRTGSGSGSTCRWRARCERVAALVALLQRGRISVYLMYSFATLLVLLLFVR